MKKKAVEVKSVEMKSLEVLENAQGKDFYTTEYQDALQIAIRSLREIVKAQDDTKKKNLISTRERITAQEAIDLLVKYIDNELCYSVKFQYALELAIDVLRSYAYPTAHWIFSGDDDDYDGYYINCSSCGSQRMAYGRNNELDIPAACPSCCARMDLNAWSVQAQVREKNPDILKTLYQVVLIYDNGQVARPYMLTTRASNEDEAKEKAIEDVLVNWIHNPNAGKDVYVDSVEVIR